MAYCDQRDHCIGWICGHYMLRHYPIYTFSSLIIVNKQSCIIISDIVAVISGFGTGCP